MNKAHEVLAGFRRRFGTSGSIYRAPGRVNLIGEHTDYNDGFVMPAALRLFCWVAIAPRGDRKLELYSENYNESFEASLDRLPSQGGGKWSDYTLGVARVLEGAGMRCRGANIYISGEVPLGAGLSSSAAIEVSVGYALLDISQHSIDRTQLAILCQRAENEFVGARCGIMDQFISCHGRAGRALLLDCRSLEFEFVALPPRMQLVICNTMVKHEIAASGYNTRRAECEEGVRRLGEVLLEVRALRDVSLAQLEQHRGLLTETIYRRCRHVITENARVLQTASTFQRGEVSELRQLMSDSHRSLRDDFEVSCGELDTMVEIASRQGGVYGARMIGGGFGGSTINLVEASETLEFRRRVAAEYESATGMRPDIYVCEASAGVEALPQSGGELSEGSQGPERSSL